MLISKDTQETVTFIASIIQTLVIVFGGLWAVITFVTQQNAATEATLRELQRPYYEKQLSLYLEASRVVAHLAQEPTGPEKEALESRFWELFYGELAFVESQLGDVPTKEIPIAEHMRKFCTTYFNDRAKCISKTDTRNLVPTAIGLAHQARDEIKRRWTATEPVQGGS